MVKTLPTWLGLLVLPSTVVPAPGPPRGRRFNNLMALMQNRLANVTTDPIEEISLKIRSYGCHCFPGNSKGPTVDGGVPVDGIDSACKQLAVCRRCIQENLSGRNLPEIDTAYSRYKFLLTETGAESREDEDGYSSLKWEGQPTNQAVDCSHQSEGRTDLTALCNCDNRFAEDLAKVYHQWNATYWQDRRNELQSRSDFDRKSLCRSPAKAKFSVPKNLQCCGNFPSPAVLYDANTKICCQGKVTSIGSC